jgi:hypothetical protein
MKGNSIVFERQVALHGQLLRILLKACRRLPSAAVCFAGR